MRRSWSQRGLTLSFIAVGFCVIAEVIAGCASEKPALVLGTNSATAADAATVQLIWPCVNSPLFGSGRGNPPMQILADEKVAGRISSCSYATVKLPAGSYPIRIADPAFDLRGLAGNTGPKFDVPPGASLHYILRPTGGSGLRLIEIDSSRAQAEIKLIDQTP